MKKLDENWLAKVQFGIVASLDDLFDGFIYCRQEPAPQGGTRTVRPNGWYFCSGREATGIVTFQPGKHPGSCLYTKPKPHVLQAVLERSLEGEVGAFYITAWPGREYALVHATDSTGIANPWLAFVLLDSLPEINPENTSTWSPTP